jgi:hypothetical protein
MKSESVQQRKNTTFSRSISREDDDKRKCRRNSPSFTAKENKRISLLIFKKEEDRKGS